MVQINLTDNLFLSNKLFKQYNLEDKIKKFISNLEEEERERQRETIDFSKPFNEQSREEALFEARNKIKDDRITEYHSELVEKMDNNGDEDDVLTDVTLDFNNVDKLIKKIK